MGQKEDWDAQIDAFMDRVAENKKNQGSLGNFFDSVAGGIGGAAEGVWNAGERLVGGIGDLIGGHLKAIQGVATFDSDKIKDGFGDAIGGTLKGASSLGVVGDAIAGAAQGSGLVTDPTALMALNIAGSFISPFPILGAMGKAGSGITKALGLGSAKAGGAAVTVPGKAAGMAGGAAGLPGKSGSAASPGVAAGGGLGKSGAAGGAVSLPGKAGSAATAPVTGVAGAGAKAAQAPGVAGGVGSKTATQGVAAGAKLEKPAASGAAVAGGGGALGKAETAAILGSMFMGGAVGQQTGSSQGRAGMSGSRTQGAEIAFPRTLDDKLGSSSVFHDMVRDSQGPSSHPQQTGKIHLPVPAKAPIRVKITRPTNL